MNKPTVTLIEGDGIGPEIAAATVRAIEAAGGSVEVLALPWPTGRPPSRGNALMNR